MNPDQNQQPGPEGPHGYPPQEQPVYPQQPVQYEQTQTYQPQPAQPGMVINGQSTDPYQGQGPPGGVPLQPLPQAPFQPSPYAFMNESQVVPPKKGFPKIILIAAVLLVVILLVVLGIALASKSKTPAATETADQPTTNQTESDTSLADANPADVSNALTATVQITKAGLTPSDVLIKTNTTVQWINDDTLPHTITSSDFADTTIEAGESSVHTYKQAGSYKFTVDSYTGTISVKD